MLCLCARVDGTTHLYPLPDHEARIGRSGENDIVIPSKTVSENHAVITRSADGFVIADHGSKNGVIVNGVRVASAKLTPGIVIVLGRAHLTIEEQKTSETVPALRARTDARQRRKSEPETEPIVASGASEAVRMIKDALNDGVSKTASRLQSLLGAASVHCMEVRGEETAMVAAAGALPDEIIINRLMKLDPAARIIERIGSTSFLASIAERRRVRTILVATFKGSPRHLEEWEKDAFECVAALAGAREHTTPIDARRDQLDLETAIALGSSRMRAFVESVIFLPGPNDTILLLGERGTGKELMAKLLHEKGPFANGDFVSINCASLSESLADSELFGIRAHAATGVAAGKGAFGEADEGTLFLDEIGNLSHGMQGKLLRAIQEKTIRPVGQPKEQAVRLRIVAATNQPEALRPDLYERFEFVFHVPPLRDRRDDIAELVRHFIEEVCRERGIDTEVAVSLAAMRKLEAYDWPGNVRQLRSIVRRAVAKTNGGMLHSDAIEFEASAAPSSERKRTRRDDQDWDDRQRLLESLEEHGWNKSAVARDFQRGTAWVRDAMKRLGIAEK